MNKVEFLKLIMFPAEWEIFGMYHDELFLGQLSLYSPGDEQGAEHDRNGAFHWWLKRQPSKEELIKLVRLTFLDPDPLMAQDVRTYIAKAINYDKDVHETLMRLTNEHPQ